MAARALVTEVMHVAGGMIATALVFAAGAWAYPPGRETVWLVGYATIVAVAAMGVPQIRQAWIRGGKRNG